MKVPFDMITDPVQRAALEALNFKPEIVKRLSDDLLAVLGFSPIERLGIDLTVENGVVTNYRFSECCLKR